MSNTDKDLVVLLRADGTLSSPMPRERAAFIVAFTFSGKRPEIIETNTDKRTKDLPLPYSTPLFLTVGH